MTPLNDGQSLAASAPNLTVPRASNQMMERSPTPSRLLMAPVVRTPLRHQRVHLQMKDVQRLSAVEVTGFPPAAKI